MSATRSRRADVAAGFGALATLLVVLVGVPLLLAALAGWPLPRQLPNPTQIRNALDNGWAPDDIFVLKVVAVVAWLAWLQIAFSILAELLSTARGWRRVPRLWL